MLNIFLYLMFTYTFSLAVTIEVFYYEFLKINY